VPYRWHFLMYARTISQSKSFSESNSGALPQVNFTNFETSVAICPATLLLHAFPSMVLIDSYHMQADYKLCRLDDARVPT